MCWSSTEPPSRRACRLAFVLALFAAFPAAGRAHDEFERFVQHRVTVEVKSGHLDITVELTFFETWSGTERAAMDADRDGRITPTETAAYAKALGARLAGSVEATLEGRPLPVLALRDPEVDLLGEDRVVPSHHRLRIACFAPLPAPRPLSAVVRVEERLWPKADTLVQFIPRASEGATLEPGTAVQGLQHAEPGRPHVLVLNCAWPSEP